MTFILNDSKIFPAALASSFRIRAIYTITFLDVYIWMFDNISSLIFIRQKETCLFPNFHNLQAWHHPSS